MTTLVFVYAVDHGLFNALTGSIHKLLSPRTYRCSLCAITHGPLSMRDEWRRFVETLGHAVEFLHRDELAEEGGVGDVDLPAVLLRDESGALTPWIDASALDAVRSIAELKDLVRERLAALPGATP